MSEVLFEYMRSGTSIKVTAIEPETGVEAIIIVPVGLSEQQMQAKAMQKLLYVLKKKDDE
jgi:hypothetical protein